MIGNIYASRISDVPRSRLVKYPLLLKQVVKYSDDTDDIRLLQAAISYLEQVNIYPVPKKISICKKFTEFAGYRYQVPYPADRISG